MPGGNGVRNCRCLPGVDVKGSMRIATADAIAGGICSWMTNCATSFLPNRRWKIGSGLLVRNSTPRNEPA